MRSKSRGVPMPKKEFEALSGSDLDAAEENLARVGTESGWQGGHEWPFSLATNESKEFFFEELDLLIGPVEQAPLRVRNSMAYEPSTLLDEGRHQDLFDHTQSYRTHFNGVLLKLLGYDGGYVDYSARWRPERPLYPPFGGQE